MRSDGCGEGESSESMPQKCWDLLHGASTPPPQAPSEPTPQECRAPQKAPNEAKPESTQSSLSPGFESSARGPAGRERSRSAAGGAVPHNAGNDSFDPIALADESGSRNVGRVADGIRTRDIQIHNLDTAPLNRGQDNDLRQPSRSVAHLLPTDTCKTDPDLAAIVVAWPELPEAIKAGIVAMVKAASGSG